jgi:hypothetical protein
MAEITVDPIFVRSLYCGRIDISAERCARYVAGGAIAFGIGKIKLITRSIVWF